MKIIDNITIFECEMKNHLDFEISQRGYRRLFERLGYPTDVLDFTRGLMEVVKKQVRETSETNNTKFTYTEKDFKSEIPFVEKYKITIEMSIETGDSDSEGGFNNRESLIYINDGKIFLYPVITIFVNGETKIDLRNEVFSTIGHEMTHGYSSYMTLMSKKNVIRMVLGGIKENAAGVDVLLNTIKDKTKSRYDNIIKAFNKPLSSVDKKLAGIAYIYSEPEKRAEISELRHELENQSHMIKDSRSATDAIAHSHVYRRNYERLNDYVDDFVNLAVDGKYSNIHDMLLRAFNRVFDKKYVSLEKAVVFLNNIRNDYNRFFMNKSGKIVQDIIDSNVAASGYVGKMDNKTMMEAVDELLELVDPL